MNRLDNARESFARDWHDLRRSMRRETGAEPRWRANLVWPTMALAIGVAAGAALRWRQSRKD